MKRILIGVGVLLLLAAGAAAGIWAWKARNPADVRGSATQEFETTEEPGATTRPETEILEEPWPQYGFDLARTRYAPDFKLRPPFRRLWDVRGGKLIEYPPVVAYGHVYFATSDGRFFAVDAETGKKTWERELGRCTAASPAAGNGIVYQPVMHGFPCGKRRNQPSFLFAMDAHTGAVKWRFRAGVIETSPLLVDGRIYVGSWDTRVYALDAATGRKLWSFKTGDAVKGGAAFAKGTIFVGSYDGHVYALNSNTGKLRWRASAQSRFGGKGTFYATPAVAYGRVYIGNTDGKVYAFGAQSGKLLWSKTTGNYVYSSAAVWDRKVYAGSYDGHFYALDAATGDIRWKFEAHGPISGSPTVLDGIVYFSTLKQRTFALDARTGRRVWTFPDGKYSPVVADEKHLYLTGYTRVYALEPSSR
ncbi:MAG TPA: PQQ-binding-like beta-propeller repeat protein [Vicinamibacteria bacterium]|jgi:outer membrane protein assembly factor BamB